MAEDTPVADTTDAVHSVFRGNLNDATIIPPTRIASIFISSNKKEFEVERDYLHQVILPRLGYYFLDQGVRVHLMDPHEGLTYDLALDATLSQDQLMKIKECYTHSIGCFCLVLVGKEYTPYQLPTRINSKKFNEIRAVVIRRNLNQNALPKLYELDDETQDYILKHNLFEYIDFQNSPEMVSKQETILSDIYQIFEEIGNEESVFLKSVVESQFDFAINLSPNAANRIVGVVKTDEKDVGDVVNENRNLERIRKQIHSNLQNNLITLSYNSSIEEFGEKIFDQLKLMVEQSLAAFPSPDDLGQSYYDLYVESSAHLLHCQQILATENYLDNQLLLDTIKCAITDSSTPIILTGGDTCGKTTALSVLATRIGGWLGSEESTVCVVRYLGLTPRSMYLGEFLRSLCMQLSFIFGLEIQAKHCNFDVNKLFSWFDSLLCAVQSMSSSNLVILLDDLHLLKLPPFKQQHHDGFANGALAWLPFRLPSNVRIVCTMASSTKSLTVNVDRVLGRWKSTLDSENRIIQFGTLDETTLKRFIELCLARKRPLGRKEKEDLLLICIKNAENLLSCRLLIELATNFKINCNCSDNLAEIVCQYMNFLEEKFGVENVARISKYLTCTRYGMTDVEMREVCENNCTVLLSSPILLHRLLLAMDILLMRRFADNKILLSWRHRCLTEINKTRYFPTQKSKRAVHSEIANLLLVGFLTRDEQLFDSKEKESSIAKYSKYRHLQCLRADHRWASIRPIEELWFHLLHTGDVTRIKQATVCNLQFLQVAVQAGSICYVLGVLELVRTQILDIEIELVYHTLKLGTDILSKEPLQLASQIVAWIRRFIDGGLDNVDCLVNQALDWCKRQTVPLLAPINSWLWTPLPQQATVLCLPLSVASIAVTHDSQYVICTTADKIIHMYHVASRQLIRTFTGHKDRVCCVHVEKTGQYLVSGSEDTTVIVWDLVAATIYRTISEHFATVTCVATTQHDTVVISGSDDSRVIIVQLATGDVIQKLEHHRGSIVAVAVTDNDDVLVTGSNDSTVCVWSLDNFNLLNTIKLPFPVTQMDLSVDSTFLLVACEDNNLYLRSLATGSEIHTIRGREVAITKVQIASDNCRASVAYEDDTLIVYDIHTTRCVSTLICPASPVTGLKISSDDSFLFTASGEKITVWYFNRNRVHDTQLNGRRVSNGGKHSDHLTCVDISKDGTMAISGSKDKLVKVWQLNQKELTCTTLEGHTGSISCVSFAPNGLYAVSGSDDKTVRVWGLTLGFIVSIFKEHQARITSIKILADSRRILSADSTGMLKLWQADNCAVLLSCLGPSSYLDVTNNMRFAICGLGDNNLRIWTVSRENHKHSVSHSDVILCHALTNDSKYVITGSRDTSLKIWDIATGRITQVLVGHTGPVSCVAVAISDQKHVFSGSHDCTVMIWDRLTGHNIHTLTGHTGFVTCVQVTADGSIVISGSSDMTVRAWDGESGDALSCMDMHVPVLDLACSYDASRLSIILENCSDLPFLSLYNHPVIKISDTQLPSMEEKPEIKPRKFPIRLLHKEMSLDTYTWQKRYGGIISKRSSTISLEDFRALQGGAPAPSSDDKCSGPRGGSAASSQSSSVSDVRSTHSIESMQVPVAVALATSEVVGMLNAVHSSFGSKNEPKMVEESALSEPKDLDVAPWEAEETCLKQESQSFVVNGIHNSEICALM